MQNGPFMFFCKSIFFFSFFTFHKVKPVSYKNTMTVLLLFSLLFHYAYMMSAIVQRVIHTYELFHMHKSQRENKKTK